MKSRDYLNFLIYNKCFLFGIYALASMFTHIFDTTEYSVRSTEYYSRNRSVISPHCLQSGAHNYAQKGLMELNWFLPAEKS